jgi:hypothetical protein
MGKTKDTWLQIRVAKEEKEAIEKLAASENLPVGTFIRKTVLDLCKSGKKR